MLRREGEDMNIEYNYHTHNFRCGHAIGDCFSYALEAKEKGLKKLGFSDHGPYAKVDFGFRMDYSLLDEYVEEIVHTKEKYRNELEIKAGLEIEYLPNESKYYEELLTKRGIEYLVLGQHFFEDSGGKLKYVYGMEGTKEYIEYAKSAVEGMETGYFSFLAHPDLIFVNEFKWDYNCEKACDIIIDAAVKRNFMIEYNANGFRRGKKEFLDGVRYEYPHDRMFELAAQAGVKVLINSDCHNPNQVCDEYMEYAYKRAKELKLNLKMPDNL